MEISIKKICEGDSFIVDFNKVMVERCHYINSYDERVEELDFLSSVEASISRNIKQGAIQIQLFDKKFNIHLPSIVFLTTNLSYDKYDQEERAQTSFGIQEINPVMFSELEYGKISLFLISKLEGEVVAFLILNPKNVDDYYYRLTFWNE